MRRLFIKGFLLALPFAAYAAVIAWVDPYNFLWRHSSVPDGAKLKTSYQLNPCLWKMVEFSRRPCPNILLGDSRMGSLPAEKVSRVAGSPYYNFFYGGASLNEVIATFWFAASKTRLESVYIGVNFNLYNDYNNADRTDSYKSLETNPLLYFTNRTVVKAAYYNLNYVVRGIDPKFGVPVLSLEEYWKDTIGPLTAGWYGRYVYPVRYHQELMKIGDYSKSNGIRLRFIIFPSHIELQGRVHDFALEGAYQTFKRDLAAIGTTYDYDFSSPLTVPRENFKDPMHFVPAIADMLIEEIWTEKIHSGHVLAPGG